MTGKPHNNTNPRKFKEKIELLRQKEAQLTANFMEVMRGIPTLTRNVVPYPDLPNKELLQPDSYSPTLRPPLDSTKSSGYTRRRDNSGNYQYTLETSTGTLPGISGDFRQFLAEACQLSPPVIFFPKKTFHSFSLVLLVVGKCEEWSSDFLLCSHAHTATAACDTLNLVASGGARLNVEFVSSTIIDGAGQIWIRSYLVLTSLLCF
ncbi:hypothetical protein ECG_07827 [Echinococcus granulosus]|nr:hypothetical protein ECG_07827 [Echinococcus granulosus]